MIDKELQYTPKPIAIECEVQYGNWRFMTRSEYNQCESQGFKPHTPTVKYWRNEDMEYLIKVTQKGKMFDDHPEHINHWAADEDLGDIENVAIAYINNVVNPYVRFDNDTRKYGDRFSSALSPRLHIHCLAQNLKMYPIIGYGFPAFLSAHSRIDNGIIHYSYYGEQINLEELFKSYYDDRLALYKACHTNEYEAYEASENDVFEGDEAKQRLHDLQYNFDQKLLKQEEENIDRSQALFDLFGSELNMRVEYFLQYLQKKVDGATSLGTSKLEADRPCNKAEKPQPKFSDIVQPLNGHTKEEIINRLHVLIDGNRGAAVGAAIMKAKTDGYLIGYPTKAQFLAEFTLRSSWQAVSNYFNENDNKCLAKSGGVILFD